MCKYHYRINTKIPIQKTLLIGDEFYHPNAESIGRINYSHLNLMNGKVKHPGWTNWSHKKFESVDECINHCLQYFPFRKILNSRIIEIGETKFVHIKAYKNDNIDRILLHIEEV